MLSEIFTVFLVFYIPFYREVSPQDTYPLIEDNKINQIFPRHNDVSCDVMPLSDGYRYSQNSLAVVHIVRTHTHIIHILLGIVIVSTVIVGHVFLFERCL